jgi:predicted DCC family thiol-disulfide oxidoreductase YuxK
MRHLILYDSTCPFCKRWVHRIICHDPTRLFAFAPLSGSTAARFPTSDSLILIENYATRPLLSIEGVATVRIFRQLTFPYNFLGTLGRCLPSALLNALYRLIARNRRFFSDTMPATPPDWSDRFLP